MKKLISGTVFVSVLMVVMSSLPLFGTCYEVGFKVKNAEEVSYVSIPIRVYDRFGGIRIDNGNLKSSPASSGYNFKIDLNDNCPPYPPDCPVECDIISLDPGTEYVIVFEYPGGENSVCFKRDQLQCTGGIYDTFYVVTPDTVDHESGTDICEEETMCCEPNCQVSVPLSASLVIYNTVYNGKKIDYYLRATASGGNQSYTFTWSGASRTSPTNTTNPNEAKRSVWPSQTVTVSVTVTSDGQSVTKYKTLYGDDIYP